MAKKNNRKCICCSTEYRYCNTCAEDANKPAWYAIYCSENCKKLFHAASGYHAQTATLEEVKARFDACDLSYKDKLNENFIEAINAAYEIKKENVEIKEEENVVSTDVESVIEAEEKVEVAEKIKYGKSNKKKVVFE